MTYDTDDKKEVDDKDNNNDSNDDDKIIFHEILTFIGDLQDENWLYRRRFYTKACEGL